MTELVRTILLKALAQYRGDDYERASMAFRGLPQELMDSQYGQSGSTRQQILDGYKKHVDNVQIAVDWVKSA